MPIGHMPIGHHTYLPLCLSAIMFLSFIRNSRLLNCCPSFSVLLAIIPIWPISYYDHQQSSQLTIMPINHHAYRTSYLSAIMPISHHIYQQSCLSAIMPIGHHTDQQSYLSKPNLKKSVVYKAKIKKN